jgi:hypothetical protein
MRFLSILMALWLLNFYVGAQTNLQNYTPSVLFQKGQWELKSFQNIYQQSKSFSANFSKTATGRGSEIYASSINQFLYGLSSNINIGFDVWAKGVKLQNSTRENWGAVANVGPKIKIAPFNNLPRFSIQSTWLFPTSSDLEGRESNNAFLENDRQLWLTQFFYDKALSSKWQLFVQQAFWYSLVRNSYRENNFLETPVSAFISFFLNNKITLYGMTEYWPTHYNANLQKGSPFYEFFVQSGLGSKYQIIPSRLEVELLYTNFWLGSETKGAGQTFNLGIRLIK